MEFGLNLFLIIGIAHPLTPHVSVSWHLCFIFKDYIEIHFISTEILLHNFFVFSAIVQPPRHQNKPCGVHLSFEIAVIQNNNGPISGQSISQIKWYIFVAWTGITDCKNQYYQMKMYDNFSRNKLMYNNIVDSFIL